MSKIVAFLKNESGATAIEYGLIAAGISVAIIAIVNTIGSTLNTKFTSISSQLKAWIDRIMVAGKTFRYTENGPEGLAKGKRVIVGVARGGFYNEGSPARAFEHLETYLRGIFNFIGIEPEFVAADGLNIGSEQRAESIRLALGETVRLAA